MAASPKWRKVGYAAVVGVILVFGVLQSGMLIILGNYFAVEGDVVSVAPGSRGQREAVVRLNLGPVVTASVPAACLVFPGQIAKVNFTGPVIGSEPAFRLWESWDK